MKRKRLLNGFVPAILCSLLFGLILISLCLGNYNISLLDLCDYVRNKAIGGTYDTTVETVLLNIRLTRIIASVVFGAALAVAGLIYQNVFSNNMVSPDLLGVSSSAACGAAIAIILGLSKYTGFFCSFVFSVIGILLAGGLSKFLKRSDGLLLSGIIVAGFARSGLGLLKYLADPENGQLESIVYWEMGSMAKVTWLDLTIVVPVITVILVLLYLLRRRIGCLALGKSAELLGIHVSAERILAIILSSLLVSLSTAVCGVISWIGLIIPLVASALTKSGSPEDNFVVTALIGSVFLLASDDFARAATASEIPISIITGAGGLFIFCVIIFAERSRKKA